MEKYSFARPSPETFYGGMKNPMEV